VGWFNNIRLLRAAGRGDTDAVGRLVAAGADLSARNGQGLTPLMLAANHGHCRAIELLVDLGADVNASSTVVYPGRWSGFTALMAACCDSTGEPEPVSALLRLGADPAAADNLGRRAIDYARLSGYPEIEAVLENAG
jgi:ankyrin repeat protein